MGGSLWVDGGTIDAEITNSIEVEVANIFPIEVEVANPDDIALQNSIWLSGLRVSTN